MGGYTGLIAGFAVFHGISIITTIIRLIHRYRRRQLWWDDFWVLIALAFTIFTSIVSVIGAYPPQGGHGTAFQAFSAWSGLFVKVIAVWTSRLSIQSTVILFLPPGRNRDISKWGFAGLCVGGLTVIITRIFYNGLPVPVIPCAPWDLAPTIINLVLNIIATAWLVGWPAYILSRMKLRKRLRRLLMACFSSAILLLAAGIFHAVNILTHASHITIISSHLELVLSVVVANVLVLAAYLYRVIHGSEDEDGSDNETTTEAVTKTEDGTRMVTRRDLRTGDSQGYAPMSTGNFSSEVGTLTTVYTSGDELSQFSQPGRSAYSGQSRNLGSHLYSTFATNQASNPSSLPSVNS